MKRNVAERTLFIHDNLPVLEGMNSESVDLIYLDPPFNSNRNYAAPIGSSAAGASFKDAWTLDDIDLAWMGQLSERYADVMAVITAVGRAGGKGDKSYLIFMARRLIELHRVLKESGSIYLHCDPVMSHSLKLLMDCIFGKANFKNEIIWHYNKWTNASKYFQRNHDIIFMYSKTNSYNFNKLYGDPTKRQLELRKAGYNTGSSSGRDIVRIYDRKNPKVINKLKSGEWDNRDIYDVNVPEGSPIPDVWKISVINGQSRERTGYPTQKPLALLDRIVKASSNEGDVVLDPFCGCATACVAAEVLKRQWIGIDISVLAKNILRSRLEKAQDMYSTKGAWRKVNITETPPVRTDNADLSVSPKEYKHTLYGKQEGICTGCLVEFPFRNMTIDHIKPQAAGGQDTKDNLQLLCGACNSKKGDRSMESLIVDLRNEGIRER